MVGEGTVGSQTKGGRSDLSHEEGATPTAGATLEEIDKLIASASGNDPGRLRVLLGARHLYRSDPSAAQRLLDEVIDADVLLDIGRTSELAAPQAPALPASDSVGGTVQRLAGAGLGPALSGPSASTDSAGGSGSARRGTAGCEWHEALCQVLRHTGGDLEYIRQKLSVAVQFAQQTLPVRSTLIPLELQRVLRAATNAQALQDSLRAFIMEFKQPLFYSCTKCPARRLARGNPVPPPSRFSCGHASCVFPARVCKPSGWDEQEDWAALFPPMLLQVAATPAASKASKASRATTSAARPARVGPLPPKRHALELGSGWTDGADDEYIGPPPQARRMTAQLPILDTVATMPSEPEDDPLVGPSSRPPAALDITSLLGGANRQAHMARRKGDLGQAPYAGQLPVADVDILALQIMDRQQLLQQQLLLEQQISTLRQLSAQNPMPASVTEHQLQMQLMRGLGAGMSAGSVPGPFDVQRFTGTPAGHAMLVSPPSLGMGPLEPGVLNANARQSGPGPTLSQTAGLLQQGFGPHVLDLDQPSATHSGVILHRSAAAGGSYPIASSQMEALLACRQLLPQDNSCRPQPQPLLLYVQGPDEAIGAMGGPDVSARGNAPACGVDSALESLRSVMSTSTNQSQGLARQAAALLAARAQVAQRRDAEQRQQQVWQQQQPQEPLDQVRVDPQQILDLLQQNWRRQAAARDSALAKTKEPSKQLDSPSGQRLQQDGQQEAFAPSPCSLVLPSRAPVLSSPWTSGASPFGKKRKQAEQSPRGTQPQQGTQQLAAASPDDNRNLPAAIVRRESQCSMQRGVPGAPGMREGNTDSTGAGSLLAAADAGALADQPAVGEEPCPSNEAPPRGSPGPHRLLRCPDGRVFLVTDPTLPGQDGQLLADAAPGACPQTAQPSQGAAAEAVPAGPMDRATLQGLSTCASSSAASVSATMAPGPSASGASHGAAVAPGGRLVVGRLPLPAAAIAAGGGSGIAAAAPRPRPRRRVLLQPLGVSAQQLGLDAREVPTVDTEPVAPARQTRDARAAGPCAPQASTATAPNLGRASAVHGPGSMALGASTCPPAGAAQEGLTGMAGVKGQCQKADGACNSVMYGMTASGRRLSSYAGQFGFDSTDAAHQEADAGGIQHPDGPASASAAPAGRALPPALSDTEFEAADIGTRQAYIAAVLLHAALSVAACAGTTAPPTYGDKPGVLARIKVEDVVEWSGRLMMRLANVSQGPSLTTTPEAAVAPSAPQPPAASRAEAQLLPLCCDVPRGLVPRMPRVLRVADVAPRREIPVDCIQGEPIMMWLSPDATSAQREAMDRFALAKVGITAILDKQHSLVLSPQDIEGTPLLVGVVLARSAPLS